MAQIAAEVIGLTPDKVHYVPMETHITSDMLTSSASRGTMIGGSAVKLAAEEVRGLLFKHAAEVLETPVDKLTAGDNQIWSVESPDKLISYNELAHMVHWKQERMSALSWYVAPAVSFNPRTGKGSTYFTFHWMAQVFEVTVDTETGKVSVDHVYAVHDPGRVLNPDSARGQVIGAMSFGIGYGLTEEVVIEGGRFQSGNFDTYQLLRAKDMPPVTLEFLNIPDPHGPFGAKSIGEPGLDLPGAAIPSAIAHATGYRAPRIPVTPKRLLNGLKEGKP
jgi:CO/xanthine dehydrogenase Mo-binding subunit